MNETAYLDAQAGLVDNAADAEQVAFAREVERERARRRRRAVRKVMSTYEGRELLWGELERHRIFESITVPTSTSMTFALSGRRDAGLELYAELTALSTLYLTMQQEAVARVAKEQAAAAAVRTRRAGEGAGREDTST